jgi:hypothetical protein
MLPGLIRQRAHAGRYREITAVLVEHGLGGLLAPLGLRLRRTQMLSTRRSKRRRVAERCT